MEHNQANQEQSAAAAAWSGEEQWRSHGFAAMTHPQPQGVWVPVPVFMFQPDASELGMPSSGLCAPMTNPFYSEGSMGAAAPMPFMAHPVYEADCCAQIRTPSPDPASYVQAHGYQAPMNNCTGFCSLASTTTESDRASEQWVSEASVSTFPPPSAAPALPMQQQQSALAPSQFHTEAPSWTPGSGFQAAPPQQHRQVQVQIHQNHSTHQAQLEQEHEQAQGRDRRRRRPIRTNAPTVPLRLARNGPGMQNGSNGQLEFANTAAAAAARSTEASLAGRVLELAFDASGSRQVQEALTKLNQNEAGRLATELRGHVRAAIESPHANYVLSCAIEQLPATDVHWIVEELFGAGVAVARHRYGCRVICRLMEHHPVFALANHAGQVLVDEIVEAAVQLARNEFGRHTIIKLMEQGTDERRSQVVAALLQDLTSQARHRNASYVVESALEHAPDSDRAALVRHLAQPTELVSLAQCQSGCHVIRSLLSPRCGCTKHVRATLASSMDILGSSKYGQLLLREQGLLPNMNA